MYSRQTKRLKPSAKKPPMNKQRTIVRLEALLLITALLFGGCANPGDTGSESPTPSRTRTEDSENSFGSRYSFTIEEISKELSEDDLCKDYSDFSQWETISEGLVDDNGVCYSSCCIRADGVIFTAAVENDSRKVMNIGCGCQSDQLERFSFRLSFFCLAASIAVHAGGYDKDDAGYFIMLFTILLYGEEDTLCYGDSLYIKSVDRDTTVLMTAPCSQRIIREKHYKVITDDRD